MKHLVIHAAAEGDLFLCALPMDDAFRRDLSRRMNLLKSFPAEEEVCTVGFRCSCVIYEADTDAEWDSENVNGGDCSWSIVDGFWLTGEVLSLEGAPKMVLSEYGMWITAREKHGGAIECETIHNKDLKEILKP